MKGKITDYIPQRAPMVMVDVLTQADNRSAQTTFKIPPENIFVENGYLAEGGLIENIAQTAAAMAGYQYAQLQKPAPVGYIAAIKNLNIHSLPSVSTTLNTRVVVRHEVLDYLVIEGTVQQAGVSICSCEMKILIKK